MNDSWFSFVQFSGARGGGDNSGGNNSIDMIQGAMKAYKMFSGGQDNTGGGGGGGGNFLDNISMIHLQFRKHDAQSLLFQVQHIKMLRKCMLFINNLIRMVMEK